MEKDGLTGRPARGSGRPARWLRRRPRRADAPRPAALTAALVLLAVGSGATDAFSLAGLGEVFTSVMTGNLVLLGLAVVRAEPAAAARSAVSVAAYATASLVAARWLHGTRAAPETPWPERVNGVLAVVAGAQAGVLAGWLAAGTRPGLPAQLALIAVSAAAMGMQSTAVNALAVGGAATTYLTGTLTTLMTEVATTGEPATMRRRLAVLAAALGGAGVAAALLLWLRPAVPLLPVATTASAIALTSRGRR